MWRQLPPNLEKNPPQNYVEGAPTLSQKESTPNFLYSSSLSEYSKSSSASLDPNF
jgi:hypothetical protein